MALTTLPPAHADEPVAPQAFKRAPIFIHSRLQEEYGNSIDEGRFRITTVIPNPNNGHHGFGVGFIYLDETYRTDNLASMRSQRVSLSFEAQLQNALPSTLNSAIKETVLRGVLSDPTYIRLRNSHYLNEKDLIESEELNAFDAKGDQNPKARDRFLKSVGIYPSSAALNKKTVQIMEERDKSLAALLEKQNQLLTMTRQMFAHLNSATPEREVNLKAATPVTVVEKPSHVTESAR